MAAFLSATVHPDPSIAKDWPKHPHVTIGYWPDMHAVQLEASIGETVALYSKAFPIAAPITGAAWLGLDGRTPAALISHRWLQSLREAICKRSQPDMTWPHFIPHITGLRHTQSGHLRPVTLTELTISDSWSDS